MPRPALAGLLMLGLIGVQPEASGQAPSAPTWAPFWFVAGTPASSGLSGRRDGESSDACSKGPSPAAPDAWLVSGQARLGATSDFISFSDATRERYGTSRRDGGRANRAVAFSDLRLEASRGRWHFGVVRREELYGYATDRIPDYLTETTQPNALRSERYSGTLRATTVAATGLTAGVHSGTELFGGLLQWSVSANVLKATTLRDFEFSGRATRVGPFSLDMDAQAIQSDSERRFVFGPTGESAGQAYSADLAFQWQVQPSVQIQAILRDAVSRVRWSSLETTRYLARGPGASTDEAGAIQAGGTVQFQNKLEPKALELPRKWMLRADMQLTGAATKALPLTQAFVASSGWAGLVFHQVGMSTDLFGSRLTLDYEFVFQSVGVQWNYGDLIFGLRTQRLGGETRSLGLAATYRVLF